MPSFVLLFSQDSVNFPLITTKVIGSQWFWSYEMFCSFKGEVYNVAFESYMAYTEDISSGDFRLLEVDNRLYVPYKMHLRFLVTANDVLHSWTVPSLGFKVDACPGRLNQVETIIHRPGIFYGQCSEICGINHGFMPIVVEAISLERFLKTSSALACLEYVDAE